MIEQFLNHGFLDTWKEFNRLQQDLNRHLSPTSVRAFPELNIWSSGDKLLCSAEIPGVDPNDLDISVHGHTLVLRGNRQPAELREGEHYHRQERFTGNFSRTFELPYRIDPEKVQATYQNGVLFLTLNRPEEDKPRKIQVRAG